MNSTEQELFKSMSLAIMFRLGFQSLLTATARQKGPQAMPWLDEFEARVISDVRRIAVTESVPDDLVDETIEAAAGEFRQVFAAVRRTLESE
ncbi:MAG TPA: hypothetical protein VHG92_14845 [Afifellaceae bacterium]|nr:hypothetical protein [Afifellaceae bacterium]